MPKLVEEKKKEKKRERKERKRKEKKRERKEKREKKRKEREKKTKGDKKRREESGEKRKSGKNGEMMSDVGVIAPVEATKCPMKSTRKYTYLNVAFVSSLVVSLLSAMLVLFANLTSSSFLTISKTVGTAEAFTEKEVKSLALSPTESGLGVESSMITGSFLFSLTSYELRLSFESLSTGHKKLTTIKINDEKRITMRATSWTASGRLDTLVRAKWGNVEWSKRDDGELKRVKLVKLVKGMKVRKKSSQCKASLSSLSA